MHVTTQHLIEVLKRVNMVSRAHQGLYKAAVGVLCFSDGGSDVPQYVFPQNTLFFLVRHRFLEDSVVYGLFVNLNK